MKGRLSVLLAVVALGVGAAGITSGEVAATPASHCSSSYTNANLPWGHKCLRAGQYCKLSGDRYYHRYRYHCHSSSRDRNGSYHLTR